MPNCLLQTSTPVAVSSGRSSAKSHHIQDCIHTDNPRSRSLEVGELIKSLAKPTRILKEFLACLDHLPLGNSLPLLSKLCPIVICQARLGFQFPRRCLHQPWSGGRWGNLASLVNRQVSIESMDSEEWYNFGSYGRSKSQNSTEALTATVSRKLEEGDYKGVVRLAYSSATTAEQSPSTV